MIENILTSTSAGAWILCGAVVITFTVGVGFDLARHLWRFRRGRPIR